MSRSLIGKKARHRHDHLNVGVTSLNLSLKKILNSRVETLSIFDTDKRPLGEAKAPASERPQVKMKLVSCPYSGSRQNHKLPMNISPLPRLISDWPAILTCIKSLQYQYLSFTEASGKNLSIRDLMFFSEVLAAIPVYMQNIEVAMGTELPTVLSGLFKVVVGPRAAFRDLCLQCGSSPNLSIFVEFTSEVMIELIESKGYLIGQTEVCSGPNNLINELIKILCDPIEKESTAPNLLIVKQDINFSDLAFIASLSTSMFLLEKLAYQVALKLADLRHHGQKRSLKDSFLAKIKKEVLKSRQSPEEDRFQKKLMIAVLQTKNFTMWSLIPAWSPDPELLHELSIFLNLKTIAGKQELRSIAKYCETLFETLFISLNPPLGRNESFQEVLGYSLIEIATLR